MKKKKNQYVDSNNIKKLKLKNYGLHYDMKQTTLNM